MRQLSDYTKEQIEQFESMRLALEKINKQSLESGEIKTPLPYSKEQMVWYSQYCQIKLREELSDELSEED